MAVMSWMSVIVPLLAGLAPLPVGLPPAPDDASLLASAPQQCLVYVGWAGTAEADKVIVF